MELNMNRLIGCLSVFCTLFAGSSQAEDRVFLKENQQPGALFHVDSRLKIEGDLQIPVEPGKPSQTAKMSGESRIKYDERVLGVNENDKPDRTFRIYRQIDFNRKVADRPQEMTLRKEVSRLVIARSSKGKTAFSPDGPLTWGELDLLRTDLFMPALAGLFPDREVTTGEKWTVTTASVQELTDLEKIEMGKIEAQFVETTTINGRKVALIRFEGDVRGVNEDGQNRQVLSGTIYFDLNAGHLAYLSLKGTSQLLGQDGVVVGKNSGQFVLTRDRVAKVADLEEAATRNLTLEANETNTLLLYENPELGIEFTFPRRWRVGRIVGQQITLDDPDGSGVLITVEPASRMPTIEAYQKETQEVLAKQQAKITSKSPIRSGNIPFGTVDTFTYEVDFATEKLAMVYWLMKQKAGGAIVVANLQAKSRAALEPEVERIARSIRRMNSIQP
jgi:hypothetical protein